jgi:hypothetical protein
MKKILTLLILIAATALPHARADEPARVLFTRMIAHWDAPGDPDYVKFVEEARPEVAQVGFYGAHFWSLSHTAKFAGH